MKTLLIVLLPFFFFIACGTKETENKESKINIDTALHKTKAYTPKIIKEKDKEYEIYEAEYYEAIPLISFLSRNNDKMKYAKAVEEYLIKRDEKPDDYYISTIYFINDTVEISLYHKSAFEEMRKAWQKDLIIVGNPGGKCGTAIYLENQNKIVEILSWQ